MDKFLNKPSASTSSKTATKTSASERHSQFLMTTHVSGGKLFCTTFNVVLDHSRKSTIQNHLISTKHKKRKLTDEISGQPSKRQATITEPNSRAQTVASEARNEICMEWVSMLAAANIPLSKTDHPAVRQFLQTRVENGGAILQAKQLQECYLSREKIRRVEEVKSLVSDKPIAIMTDEMSDANGRFVLNILGAPLELSQDRKVKSFLLDTVFLERTNHSTVGQALSKCLMEFGINLNDVIVFNTDNATYMKKAYQTILRGLCPNSVHITCLAHIMNLLGEAFRKPFTSVNAYVKNMNAMFWHAGARKSRFLRHLTEVGVRAKMPPNPIGTRWNCWYEAVVYHLEYMDHFKAFIDSELEHAQSLAPNSLKELKAVFDDEEELKMLRAMMRYIKNRSSLFVDATNLFQSQSPMAMSVWPTLSDLEIAFSDGVSLAQTDHYIEDDIPYSRRLSLNALFCDANANVYEKLSKYMTSEGQPGIKFLQDVQMFDPKKLILLPESLWELNGIPGIEDVPKDELRLYRERLGPAAVRNSDPELFWKSCSDNIPVLSSLARKYMFATVHSADVERSFSLYNLILSDRRHSLSVETLKGLMFLYYNKFGGRDFFDFE